jgi:hypothetical protein
MTISSLGQVDFFSSAAAELTGLARGDKKHSAESAAFSDTLKQASNGDGAAASPSSNMAAAMRKLDSLLLQQVVSSMLPDKSSVTFGSGLAGDVWRSMLSEHIADAMARDGRVSIVGAMVEGKTGVQRSEEGSGV